MAANRLGAGVEDSWAGSPNHYQNVSLDAFILMPNHVHGVIIIEDEPPRDRVLETARRSRNRSGIQDILSPQNQ